MAAAGSRGRYAVQRVRLRSSTGIEVTHEHAWSEGRRSFYFKDPAGNLLEIAELSEERVAAAAVRNVLKFDSGGAVEHFAGEKRGGKHRPTADCACALTEPARRGHEEDLPGA